MGSVDEPIFDWHISSLSQRVNGTSRVFFEGEVGIVHLDKIRWSLTPAGSEWDKRVYISKTTGPRPSKPAPVLGLKNKD